MAFVNALVDTTPADDELLSNGADRIREAKAALIERLASYFEDLDSDPLTPLLAPHWPILGTEVGVVDTHWFYTKPERYGIVMGSTADQTALFQNMLTSIYGAYNSGTLTAAGGGVIEWSSGYCKLLSQITFPNDGTGTPKQPAYTMRGGGAAVRGIGANVSPTGGTVLDCRYDGGGAKWITVGIGGRLTIQDLTLTDQSAATTTPFLRTAGTTITLQRVAFAGNPGKSGVTCDQDAVIFGQTGVSHGGDPGFQGYVSVMENCSFDRIRRAALLVENANAIVIRDNWVQHSCGTNLADGACFELASPGAVTAGNFFAGNQVETGSYPYPFKCTSNAVKNTFIGNGCFDANPAVTKAHYRFEAGATCEYNFVNLALADPNVADEIFSDADGSNTCISSTIDQPIIFPGPGVELKGALSKFVDGISPKFVGTQNISTWTQRVAGVTDQQFMFTRDSTDIASLQDAGSSAFILTLLGTLLNRIQSDAALQLYSANATEVRIGPGNHPTALVVNPDGSSQAGGNFTVTNNLKIGNALNVVAPTAPNRTVTIDVGGTTIYLHGKTTND